MAVDIDSIDWNDTIVTVQLTITMEREEFVENILPLLRRKMQYTTEELDEEQPAEQPLNLEGPTASLEYEPEEVEPEPESADTEPEFYFQEGTCRTCGKVCIAKSKRPIRRFPKDCDDCYYAKYSGVSQRRATKVFPKEDMKKMDAAEFKAALRAGGAKIDETEIGMQ